MPPPDESSATRNGSVPSTRAISASARRRSTEGGAIWRASESAAGSSRERSCDRGLVMEMGSYQMLHDGRNEGLATIGRVICDGWSANPQNGLRQAADVRRA